MVKENFIEMILKSIKNNWELSALSNYKKETYTYAEVARKIVFLHSIFHEIKIKKGDKISVLGKNSANWAISYFAAITYGSVIVPILNDFSSSDIHHIVNHSDSKLLLCDEAIFENLDESSMPNIDTIFSLKNFDVIFSKKKNINSTIENCKKSYLKKFNGNLKKENIIFPTISNENIAAIIYTSGTTGFSKGVVLPFNSFAANVVFAKKHMPLKPSETIVSFLPIAHAFGCTFEFLFPFISGCHITFLGKIPSPKILLQAFGEIHPRLILSVPLVIEKIYNKQIKPALAKMDILLKLPLIKNIIYKKINKKLTNVFGGNFREIVIGGASINSDVETFFKKIKFKYTVGYGMTECGPLISYRGWENFKIASVGKIVDSLKVKIDSNDPYNEVGEILVQGDNVMNGYYKAKDITLKTIDEEGWLHTGDLGIIDKENTIFIRGRSKSMILGASGQNIYPEEIEAKLNNMPYILESIIVERNGRLMALVYPDMTEVDSSNISDDKLKTIIEKNRNNLNKELSAYMKISSIEIYYNEFEKTPKKSIKRYLYK